METEKKLHEEFQDKTGKLRDKLAKESQLAAAQRVYVVDSHILGPLIRDRAQILEKKTILSEQNAVTNKVPLTLTRWFKRQEIKVGQSREIFVGRGVGISQIV